MKSTASILFCLLSLFSSLSSAQLSDEEVRQIDSLKLVARGNYPDSLKLSALRDWDNLIYHFDSKLDLQLNLEILEISNRALTRPNLTMDEMNLYYGYKAMGSNNLGLIYLNQGNYKEGLINFQISLQIGEFQKDSSKQANAYNNIGMIYKHLKLPEKALEYYDKSLLFNNDTYSSGTYYNNVGICYMDMGDREKALECYKKSLVYGLQADDIYGVGNTLSNIGLVYVALAQYDSAVTYFNKAILLYDQIGDYSGEAYSVKNIGDCWYLRGQYNLAVSHCLKALEIAKISGSLGPQKESCDCLYRAYDDLGKTDKALAYLVQYNLLRDSMENIAKNEEVLRLDFQFTQDKQRRQDSLAFANLQEIDRLKYETDIHKKEKIQYVLFAGIGLLVIVGFFVYRGYSIKKKDARIIAQQKEEVENQKHLVEEKNKEITDSINYAKRIQEAILPSTAVMNNLLPSSFILYLPKDIVAGDFYWIEEIGDKIIFAVADCTGHGVPGAMVSVVCHNALTRAVNEFKLSDPGEILDKTRELVTDTFDSHSTIATIRDGMDIGLCVLDRTNNVLRFAGANNGLYLVRNNDLTEIKADKQPIGMYADEAPFRTQTIDLLANDLLYLYTDGYADQFGGEAGKKLKYKTLKEILLRNSLRTMTQQHDLLNKAFQDWKGNLEQIDDVCIMGVRI